MPFKLGIVGRKRNFTFGVLDRLFRFTAKDDVIQTSHGPLYLDWNHPPERFLSYLFDNALRYYEQSELGRYIEHFARPAGATFLDVGANLGIYSLIARERGFRTILIEPEPRHAEFLQRNLSVFGTVLQIALSDDCGTLPLYYEPGNPGSTSLFASPNCVKGERAVAVQTLSKFAELGELGNPAAIRLVKIDVEGFEAQVVAGMVGLLAGGWRPHIWCEVRGDRSSRNGGSYRYVQETLAGFGYLAHEVCNGNAVLAKMSDLEERAVFDLLFTPPER